MCQCYGFLVLVNYIFVKHRVVEADENGVAFVLLDGVALCEGLADERGSRSWLDFVAHDSHGFGCCVVCSFHV